MYPRRLYRCIHNRTLAGVAAGVAEYFDVDPTVVRVLWALSVIFTGGLTFLLYIVMAIIVPLEPMNTPPHGPWQPGSERWSQPWMPSTPPAGTPGTPGTTTGEAGTGTGAEGVGTEGTATGSDPAAGYGDPNAQTTGYNPSQWQNWPPAQHEHRPSNFAPLFGIVLIMLGAIALLDQLVPALDHGRLFPLFIVGVGVLLLVNSLRGRAEQH